MELHLVMYINSSNDRMKKPMNYNLKFASFINFSV